MSANPVEVIRRKRDGEELSVQAVSDLIAGYAQDRVPDYQMAAFAMAVYLNDMTTSETAALTDAMLHSGVVLSWEPGASVVDKHSTGGVGDKVSLVLAPILAALGLRVPMISGRGLGPTGGTLDKLESLPGFRTDLNIQELQQVVAEVGSCITGASVEIAPADKKLYALRDVTATVPSIPLITASIMSKKLAEGLEALVLDVKFGSGAFMKSEENARALAESLEQTGQRMGVPTRAVLTNMDQPLGRFAGNACEVAETLSALEGQGPSDLMQVVRRLGMELLVMTGQAATPYAASVQIGKCLESGAARERFEKMIHAQGGDLSGLPATPTALELSTDSAGFLKAIDTEKLGWVVIELGGGRKVLGDPIDHAVGLEMLVRLGDCVDHNQPWIRILGKPDSSRLKRATEMLSEVLTITDAPVEVSPLLIGSMES